LSSNNYNISYEPGSYTIVPADQLVIRLADASTTYGTAASYTVSSVQYKSSTGNSVVDLTSRAAVSTAAFTLSDGVGGNTALTLGPVSASLSSAGQVASGSYQVGASSIANTSANYRLVKLNADRIESLKERNLVSQQELDQVVAQLAQAEAQLQIRTAAVETAKVDLARCTITAPIDYEGFCGIKPTPKVKTISVTELHALRQSGTPHFLLDVREPDEYATARIEGSVLIPLAQVTARAGELPSDLPLYVHCKLGGRSAKAVAALEELGFTNAVNVTGGITAWSDEVDAAVPRY
jgi:rhodanese-related sulfurtransferase